MKTPEERLTRGKGNFINCTDYDDAVEAMKQYAIEYHEQQVGNLNMLNTLNPSCPDPTHHAMEIGLLDKCDTCGATE